MWTDFTSIELRDALSEAVDKLDCLAKQTENFYSKERELLDRMLDRWKELLNRANESLPEHHFCEACSKDTFHTYLPLEGWMCQECSDEGLDDFFAQMHKEERQLAELKDVTNLKLLENKIQNRLEKIEKARLEAFEERKSLGMPVYMKYQDECNVKKEICRWVLKEIQALNA